MQNTSHKTCHRIADLLVSRGVRYAVVSPGSRNAPLLIALSREERINKVVVVDERSAGFVALGISGATQRPVAVVCTSGTAVLNLAPAIAEAYYQQCPLLVITADRPQAWIDQNDSQTMRQNGVFANFVKKSYSLASVIESDEQSWYVNRILNEAYFEATSGTCRPVHINIHIGEPIYSLCEASESGFRLIDRAESSETLATSRAKSLAEQIAHSQRVMVLCGFMHIDERLEALLRAMAQRDNVVVIAEHLAQIEGERIINCIDAALSVIPIDRGIDFAPDLLIYVGGAPVSRLMKQYLRTYAAHAEQWRVGLDENIIDTMQGITMQVHTGATQFFEDILALNHEICRSDYSAKWMHLLHQGLESARDFASRQPWSDFKAMNIIMQSLNDDVTLHLSNGLTVRYAQLFERVSGVAYMCNRGVSGIDGCTSTALGASLVSEKPVLLITGDMSFAYDVNGLASQYNSARLKIVVICNDGGGIFRFIKGPSDLPELEQYFEVKRRVDVAKYAAAFGFEYFEADSEELLGKNLQKLLACDRAAILAVTTPGEINAEVLRNFYNRTKNRINNKQ